uniref:Dynein light chain n=1 Tax=Ornithorhynchus anatinus TaxID=9258 RepID=A0A6I8NWT6_ORNAN
MALTGLEEKDGHLTQVKIDEVLGLMRDVATKIPPHDAVPGGVVFLVEFLDVFLYVVLLHGLRRAVHCVLLHVLRHVRILDDSLPVRHGAAKVRSRVLGLVTAGQSPQSAPERRAKGKGGGRRAESTPLTVASLPQR